MATQIISKQCYKCKEIKSLSEFNKNRTRPDGHQHVCKNCQKKYYKSDKYKAIRKKYKQSKKGKAATRRYKQSEKCKEYQRRYRQDDRGKARDKRYRLRYLQNDKAREAVKYAIQTGKLPRPDTLQCHYCGAQAQDYHHHKGYEPQHWLDVVPICKKCHGKTRSST